MRTENLIATMMTAAMLFSGGAFAQSSDIAVNVLTRVQIVIEAQKIAIRQSVQDMIEELKVAGFTYIEIQRTFLGRARIIAYSATEMREVIMNPTTGEVLRDLELESTGDVPGNATNQANAASENGNKGGNGKGNNGNAGGGNRN